MLLRLTNSTLKIVISTLVFMLSPIFTYIEGLFFIVALILQHFGKEIIAKELGVHEDHEDVHRLYLAIYKSFVEV